LYSGFYTSSQNALKNIISEQINSYNKYYCDNTGNPKNKIQVLLDDSIEGEKNYLVLLLRLIFGIYQLSGYPQIVGGEIPYLISNSEGIKEFKTYGLECDD